MKSTFIKPLLPFIIFISLQIYANEDLHCKDPSIVTTKRPLDPKKNNSALIDFKYRFVEGLKNEPVVIKIPGGPGGTSINKDQNPSFDSRVGWIQIDPRNTGCNSLNLPSQYVTTKTEVDDILQIIKEQKLTKYILFGTSYGTMVATQLAVAIQESGLPRPSLVILEGVLGRAFNDFEQEKTFANFWQNYTAQLGPNLLVELSREAPFGIELQAWLKYFSQLLYLGVHPTHGDLASLMLKMLDTSENRKLILEQVRNISTETSQESAVFQSISCSELVENAATFKLINGQLIPYLPSNNMCDRIPLSNRYDSISYQIEVPIIYFNGSNDPATSIDLAKYHFKHQNNKDKQFVEVISGGHSALTFNLEDCYNDIMNSLILKEMNITDALKSCKLQTLLTTDLISFKKGM